MLEPFGESFRVHAIIVDEMGPVAVVAKLSELATLRDVRSREAFDVETGVPERQPERTFFDDPAVPSEKGQRFPPWRSLVQTRFPRSQDVVELDRIRMRGG